MKPTVILTKKEQALAKRELRLKEFEADLMRTVIQTLSGAESLYDLIKRGVREKVVYYNFMPVIKDSIDPVMFEKVFDWGLIFKDGFQIRHIERKVFNYAVAEIKLVTKVRERIQGFKTFSPTIFN